MSATCGDHPTAPPICHPGGGGRLSSRQKSMYYIIDRQDDTRQSTAVAQPRTTSGVRFGWSDLARPACRHDPAWRNTGLRTAATTSGVAEMLASGHRLRLWRRGGRCAIGGTWSTATGMGCGRGLWKDCAPDGKPRDGVPDRNDPALTQLRSASHDCVPKVRSCSAVEC